MKNHNNMKKLTKNQKRNLIASLDKQAWDALETRLQTHPELFRPYAQLKDGGEVYYFPDGLPSSVITRLFEDNITPSGKGEPVELIWMVQVQLCMYQIILKLLCNQFGQQGKNYFDLLFGTKKTRLLITCYPPHFNTGDNCDAFPGLLIDKVHPLFALIEEMRQATEEMKAGDYIPIFLDNKILFNLLSQPVRTITDIQTKIVFENELVNKLRGDKDQPISFLPALMVAKAEYSFALGLSAWQDYQSDSACKFFRLALKEARQAEFINFNDKDTLLDELDNDEQKVQAVYANDNSLVIEIGIAAAVSLYDVENEAPACFLMEEVFERMDWSVSRMQKKLLPYFEEILSTQESNNVILVCEFLGILTFLNSKVFASKNLPESEIFYTECILLHLRMGAIQNQKQEKAGDYSFNRALSMLGGDYSLLQSLLKEHYYATGRKMFTTGRIPEAKNMFLVLYHAYTYLQQASWTNSELTKEERIKLMQGLAIATFNLGSVTLQEKNGDFGEGLLLIRLALSQASICFGRGHATTNLIRRYYHEIVHSENSFSAAGLSLFAGASQPASSSSPSSIMNNKPK